ncbi:hypothetical protein niasHS_008435 [Heterodera schachtii]|uniref:Uncharacterized protein n=1 Tax=Heterodera schachtii TaxID=97005 RepID=A0ABD2J5Z0_HETSC
MNNSPLTPCDCSPAPFRASLAVVDAVENGSSTGYTLKSEAPPRQWAESVTYGGTAPDTRLELNGKDRRIGSGKGPRPHGSRQTTTCGAPPALAFVETTNEGTGGNYHAFLYAIVRENRRAPQQNSGGQRVIMVTNRITLMLLMIELIWLPVKSAHCWAKLSLIKEENWHKRGGSCR